MPLDQYVYPSYETPLLEAWNSRFESVWVLLHPFIRVPDDFSWHVTGHYPGDEEILAHGVKCLWSEVAAHTRLRSCARLNQALLTSIGALAEHLSDLFARNQLQAFLQSSPIWMPVEGRFEPLLQADILHTFECAGFDRLTYVPEFPQSDPIQTLPIAGLHDGMVPFPTCGSLVAPDESFLFTVDWDSFFTLFYGTRAFIEEINRARHVEGFFAAPTTEHAWFNYSMGCATITLSPEHWPA